MTDEVKKYAEKRILDSNIRMVPGHYPDFRSTEHVDMWLKMSQAAIDMNGYEPNDLYLLEKTDVDICEYRKRLDRLRRNKQNVPLDVLLTKYRKPYRALLEEIREMTMALLQDIVLEGLRIRRDGAEGTYRAINRAIEESGLLKAIEEAVYQEQDADKVIEQAKRLRGIVFRAAGGKDEEERV